MLFLASTLICRETSAYQFNRAKLKGHESEFYLIQVEEFRAAEREGIERGFRHSDC